MTLNNSSKTIEEQTESSADRMFEKARELGFSSEEIGRLKSLYHPNRKTQSDKE